jgi:short-subunit dehydrogenase
MKHNIIITGANRGIGLSFVNHYLNDNHNVYALCRTASEELKNSKAIVIEGIDVSKDDLEGKLLSSLKNISIDVLINNAGSLEDE